MTEIKQNYELYQIYATNVKTGMVELMAFPAAKKETVDEWADLVALMISKGKEKRYSNPMVLLKMKSN